MQPPWGAFIPLVESASGVEKKNDFKHTCVFFAYFPLGLSKQCLGLSPPANAQEHYQFSTCGVLHRTAAF